MPLDQTLSQEVRLVVRHSLFLDIFLEGACRGCWWNSCLFTSTIHHIVGASVLSRKGRRQSDSSTLLDSRMFQAKRKRRDRDRRQFPNTRGFAIPSYKNKINHVYQSVCTREVLKNSCRKLEC